MGAADRIGAFGGWLALLWAAHDVADHVVQTDHQAAGKAGEHTGWTTTALPAWVGPMAGHVGSYSAVQVGAIAALSALTGTRPTRGRVLAAVAFSAVMHAFIDRRWPVWRALELTGSGRFARSYVDAERELLVCERVDDDPDGLTAGEEAGNALLDAVGAAYAGDHARAGAALAYAVEHAVAVIDPEHPKELHGPYLADQALHHAALAVCAAILTGGRRG